MDGYLATGYIYENMSRSLYIRLVQALSLTRHSKCNTFYDRGFYEYTRSHIDILMTSERASQILNMC